MIFSSSSDYVEIPAKLKDTYTSELTIATWLKPKKEYVFNVIFADWTTGKETIHLSLINGVVEMKVKTDAGGGNKIAMSNNAIATDTWTHLAVTIDQNGECTIYINGVLDSRYSNFMTGKFLKFDSPKTIGTKNDDGHSYSFQGAIDEFYFYTRGLSKHEISALAKTPTFFNQ